jgi:hypothetical protein
MLLGSVADRSELQEEGAEDLMESVDRTLRGLWHGAPLLPHVEAGMPKRDENGS